MAKTFNINNVQVVELTNKLERLHRSAMPLVVRGTLNDAAFLARNKAISIFAANFTVRKKNFIRSHTGVNKSKNTFDIKQMVTEAGVIRGKSGPGDSLGLQEFGGTATDKKGIPTPSVRIGKSENKLISKRLYLKSLKGRGLISKNRKSRIVASNKAIIQYNKGKRFDVLYRFRGSRKYEKSAFMAPAGIYASSKMVMLFKKQAKFRIEKMMKK